MKTKCKLLILLTLSFSSSKILYAEHNKDEQLLPLQVNTLNMLPELSKVNLSLKNHPRITAAINNYKAEQAQSKLLQLGNYPWNLQLGSQKRFIKNKQINNENNNFTEYAASIQKTWRLPGKEQIDQLLALKKLEKAELQVGDTAHELSLQLLKLWFQVIRDNYLEKNSSDNLEVLNKMQQLITKRVKLGDAAKIELLQAQTAMLQAKSQLQQLSLRRQNSELELKKYFPDLNFHNLPSINDQPIINEEQNLIINNIIEHNHELNIYKIELEIKQLLLQRLQENLIPDPTIGIQAARERGGEEKILGLFISIPLDNQQKQTMVTAAKAEADVAESKYLEIKQKIHAEAVALYQYVNSTLANWHNLQLLKSNAKELSAISLKSYQLGESSWYNWLNSQQQFNESKISAITSQLEALENYYLLAIDAHYLWADLVEVTN